MPIWGFPASPATPGVRIDRCIRTYMPDYNTANQNVRATRGSLFDEVKPALANGVAVDEYFVIVNSRR
jgi:hypothetical protein